MYVPINIIFMKKKKYTNRSQKHISSFLIPTWTLIPNHGHIHTIIIKSYHLKHVNT